MDNILDHVVVQGQRYDIVSPTAFGDYIETIGSACINPNGYAQGSTFLAKIGNEQFFYEATAAITQGSAISEGTNCKKTTVTGREAELASEIETLDETVDSLNEALTSYVDGFITFNHSFSDSKYSEVTMSCEKPGYTPISILGVRPNDSINYFISYFYLNRSTNQITVILHTTSNSAYTGSQTSSVAVLYQKNL